MHSTNTASLYQLTILLFIVSAVLVTFYYYFKAQIFKLAPTLATKSTLVKKHPLSQVIGAVELLSISIFHTIFCISLALAFHIDIKNVFFNTNILDCIYGALIGIGCVGTSILLCTVGMKLIELYDADNAPKSLNDWLAVSGAGWIRHHKHTIKIFPIFISILIITLQIGSEETIFRSILIQLFAPYGIQTAFIVSTLLFILMQIFHMPNMMSAMFPIIGATVMGVIHGILYIYHPSITPLIISHLTFFLFTII